MCSLWLKKFLLPHLWWGFGEVFHFEAVVVLAPLAAGEHGFGDLLHGKVAVAILAWTEGGADDEQAAVRPYFIAELLELVVAEVGGGGINKILLGAVALLPVERVAGGIREPF